MVDDRLAWVAFERPDVAARILAGSHSTPLDWCWSRPMSGPPVTTRRRNLAASSRHLADVLIDALRADSKFLRLRATHSADKEDQARQQFLLPRWRARSSRP